jgi:DNA-binding XRE family transcriptional regulator
MQMNEPVDVFRVYAMCGDDECWPYTGSAWGGRSQDQRPYFMAAGRRQIAYRWVYELYYGVVLTPDKSILHSCDNGAFPIACGNPKHMRVGTHQENMEDMKARNRHGMPAHVVQAIRKLLSQGRTQQEIADLYGVARETISAIATQRNHGHVRTDEEQSSLP